MSLAESGTGQALEAAAIRPRGRLGLIRDLIVFQVKLALDGLRDLIMSPLSIAAGVIGILFGGSNPDWAYRRLMGFGRKTDFWINLFNAYDEPSAPYRGRGRTVDVVIDDIEDILRRDYAEGGVTARSLATVEAALEGLRAEAGRRAGT